MAATKTQTLPRPVTLQQRLYRLRNAWRRQRRILCPSAAEVRFIRLMGGQVIVLPFGLAIVRMGWFLTSELVQREYRIGNCWVDFAIDPARRKLVIEVDGRAYHDIVRDQRRDDFLKARGWTVMRVPAWKIWREPWATYKTAFKFIKS